MLQMSPAIEDPRRPMGLLEPDLLLHEDSHLAQMGMCE